MDFFQSFDNLVVPQEKDKSIPSPKNNQSKISKILPEGILLISELACPQVELLGELNKLLQVKQFEQCLIHRKGLLSISYYFIIIIIIMYERTHMKP